MIPPLRAFGKLERDDLGAVIGWHPLADHMTDVAVCFECLCSCHSIRRALENAAGKKRRLDERDIARLSVLAFLHDIGKANSGFQAKRWKTQADIPKGWPHHAGHGIEANEQPRSKLRGINPNLVNSFAASGGEFDPKRLNFLKPMHISP